MWGGARSRGGRARVVVHVRLAATPLARLRGLLGLSDRSPLLLAPASSVHTCFMHRAIDVVFLDAELRVVRVVRALRPWRFAAARGARAVLELPAGEASVRPGDRLVLC